MVKNNRDTSSFVLLLFIYMNLLVFIIYFASTHIRMGSEKNVSSTCNDNDNYAVSYTIFIVQDRCRRINCPISLSLWLCSWFLIHLSKNWFVRVWSIDHPCFVTMIEYIHRKFVVGFDCIRFAVETNLKTTAGKTMRENVVSMFSLWNGVWVYYG